MLETLYGVLQVMGIFTISGLLLATCYGIYLFVTESKRKP